MGRRMPLAARPFGALVVCLSLAAGATARADVIPPSPACPPGAHPRASHSGTWCEPAPCKADADCGREGATCRPWRVCTRTHKVPWGGRRALPTRTEDVALVIGSCSPEVRCSGEEEPPPPLIGEPAGSPVTCAEASFCVAPSLPPLPRDEPRASVLPRSLKACGCRVGEPAPGGAGLAAIALCALAACARRRGGAR